MIDFTQNHNVACSRRYRMFEPNMDEYLDEEVENVKHCFEMTCRAWERTVSTNCMCRKPSIADIGLSVVPTSDCTESHAGTSPIHKFAQPGPSQTQCTRLLHRCTTTPGHNCTTDHSRCWESGRGCIDHRRDGCCSRNLDVESTTMGSGCHAT